MKMALLGAGGQLGSDLVLTKPDPIELIPLRRKDVDVTSRAELERAVTSARPDVVINTAAYVRVDDAEDHAADAFAVNAVAARDLAQICLRLEIPLIHISTDYVFDGTQSGIPYMEDSQPNPVNTYGLSKYAGEIYIRNSHQMHYILRSASLYGKAGASGKGGNFVYTILKKAQAGEPLRVVDDIFMSPTCTRDLALGIWDFLALRHPYGMYHMVNSGAASWYEFARAILEFLGIHAEISPVKHTDYKTKARRPLWSVLASGKGISLRPWQEALREFLKTLSG